MNKNFKFFALGLVLLGSANYSFGQQTASVSVPASVNIIKPITITFGSLLFGNVAITEAAGTVIMAAESGAAPTRTAAGGASLPPNKGTISAASLVVVGETATSYSITLPSTPIPLNLGAAVSPVTIGTFVSSLGATPTGILAGGTQTSYVGATLTMPALTASGAYTGTFTVKVDYN